MYRALEFSTYLALMLLGIFVTDRIHTDYDTAWFVCALVVFFALFGLISTRLKKVTAARVQHKR